MTIQEKADEVHKLLTRIKDIDKDWRSVGVTIHNFVGVTKLDETWSVEALYVKDNKSVAMAANKDGVTLFGSSMKIEEDYDIEDIDKDKDF